MTESTDPYVYPGTNVLKNFVFVGWTPGPRATPSSASSHWGCITPKKCTRPAREPDADAGVCPAEQHSRNRTFFGPSFQRSAISGQLLQEPRKHAFHFGRGFR